MKQGPRWEKYLEDWGNTLAYPWRGVRLTGRGQVKNEADNVLANHYGKAEINLFAVAWRRLVKSNPDAKRRSPLGERDIIVMSLEDFGQLVSLVEDRADVSIWIQAKAAEKISVTKELAGLRAWWEEHHGSN